MTNADAERVLRGALSAFPHEALSAKDLHRIQAWWREIGKPRLDDSLRAARALEQEQTYRGYLIHYVPPPIPIRCFDWHYVHEEYDGPEDDRCGSCASAEACRVAIDDALTPPEVTP